MVKFDILVPKTAKIKLDWIIIKIKCLIHCLTIILIAYMLLINIIDVGILTTDLEGYIKVMCAQFAIIWSFSQGTRPIIGV
jgi:hypothetical protein